MKVYSYTGLIDKIKESEIVAEVKINTNRDYLIDKHLFVINRIISYNLNKDKSNFNLVNIHSSYLKKYLGNDKYREIIDNLIKLKIIFENDMYSKGSFTKSFSMHSDVLKNENPIITTYISNRFLKHFKKITSKIINDIKSNNSLEYRILTHTTKIKLIDDIARLIPTSEVVSVKSVLDNVVPAYRNNIHQIFRYSEYRSNLLEINQINSVEDLIHNPLYYKPSIAKSGRIYHPFTGIPRITRSCIRTKENKLLYEVDMASAQFSLLVMEWLNELGLNNIIKDLRLRKEAPKTLKIVLNGSVYSHIQQHSTYFRDMTYDKLKTTVLATLNDSIKPTPANKELNRLFPSFMNWVESIKKNKGHEQVSHIAMSAESNIFINVFEKLDLEIFALPIHDCILSTKENINHIKTLLCERTKSTYSSIFSKSDDLSNVFRIKRISLKDDELEKNRFNRWLEENYDESLWDDLIEPYN